MWNEKCGHIVAVVLLLAFGVTVEADVFTVTGYTTIDVSFAGATETKVFDVDGGTMVGLYKDGSGTHGFSYDGTTFTSIDVSFVGAHSTRALGVDGTNIVGLYKDAGNATHGFSYDGTTYTTLDVPGGSNTVAYGMDGSNIVGLYRNGSGKDVGFLYDGTTYTEIDRPGVHTNTQAYGIDGDNIVGTHLHTSSGDTRAHIYGITAGSWTNKQHPNTSGIQTTEGFGIYGSLIVGRYIDDAGAGNKRGFIYDGTDWSDVDFPGASQTTAFGIDGNTVVGFYHDGSWHGFQAVIPEPSTISLLAAGLLVCMSRRVVRKKNLHVR